MFLSYTYWFKIINYLNKLDLSFYFYNILLFKCEFKEVFYEAFRILRHLHLSSLPFNKP